MVDADEIRTALRTGWHRATRELTPLPVRACGRAWRVRVDDQRYVARLVATADRAGVEAGLAAIEHLRASGLAVVAPVRTADGALTMATGAGVLVLLPEPPGRPLEPRDPLDQRWWGDLLGVVHRELATFDHPGLTRWHGVRPDAPHLALEPWLRPAVGEAVAALTKLAVTDQLTYGVLHGDPSAAAFRVDVATGRTALARWGLAATGPLAYDVAAAVVDAGGPAVAGELIDGYVAAGPVARDELEAALPVLMRFRWAEQADRCARRLARADLAGERSLLAAARVALVGA